MAEALHQRTEGNPFFIMEILRHLVETGAIYREGDRWTLGAAALEDLSIPEGIREVVRTRMERLSVECNRTLTVAAVIGREFDFDQLSRLVDDPSAAPEERVPVDRLSEVLREAVEARVIDEVPGAEGLFFAAGSSGHGFKLGPAVGENLAKWALGDRSELLVPFSLARFG